MDMMVAVDVECMDVAVRCMSRVKTWITTSSIIWGTVVLFVVMAALNYRWICPVCQLLDGVLGGIQELFPMVRGIKLALVVVRWVSGMATSQWSYVR